MHFFLWVTPGLQQKSRAASLFYGEDVKFCLVSTVNQYIESCNHVRPACFHHGLYDIHCLCTDGVQSLFLYIQGLCSSSLNALTQMEEFMPEPHLMIFILERRWPKYGESFISWFPLAIIMSCIVQASSETPCSLSLERWMFKMERRISIYFQFI